MKKIGAGVIISMIGVIGLIVALVQDSNNVGGKIPLAVVFLFIMCLGIAYEVYYNNNPVDVYGELPRSGGFN